MVEGWGTVLARWGRRSCCCGSARLWPTRCALGVVGGFRSGMSGCWWGWTCLGFFLFRCIYFYFFFIFFCPFCPLGLLLLFRYFVGSGEGPLGCCGIYRPSHMGPGFFVIAWKVIHKQRGKLDVMIQRSPYCNGRHGFCCFFCSEGCHRHLPDMYEERVHPGVGTLTKL
ncbi:hypothetical protein I7I50_03461 [Histoplasma capsulatum G186AR]|uniref:Uncharacterized protein n=1 Tax=Ajellomyces capsulatus TaxID=5037 RepID=A0A8H7YN93_AJECA|nr:hypothetical protein I7I52_04368 [Histoplasma capsulatum]QSS74604.1 hypothetical protein I7I50_03461 [Histoplasma capsulatum G186AR]